VLEKEHILQTLADTRKKIDGIEGLHIPVTLKAIEEYERAGADEHFIQQQRVHLQKLYAMAAELKEKAQRLQARL
jgi:hypothetical protein